MASEYGIGFTLCFSFIVLILMMNSIRNRNLKTAENAERNIFIVNSLLVYLIVLGLFAFPLENAWTFNLCLFCGSYLLFVNYTSRQFKNSDFFNRGLLTVIICSFVLQILLTAAKIVEKNFTKNAEMSRISCSVFPSEWKNCLNWVQILMSENKYQIATDELVKVLHRQPHNFVAKKLLAYNLFKMDRPIEACPYVVQYNNYFDQNTSLKKAQEDLCSGGDQRH